ncbi:hypothetical protein MM213_16065 [Belliella sp. R4-6]|uniref:HTH luxR-type domain-containing protein n=1 Tax=Belliella alkalica TaxID=1730871 RepID=A0ABS9VEZ9_9BACT|nr:hypothetical protein [Belliella alkalica]MCH7415017.1 hypothetical protein [Belliella alkalica]
MFSNHYLSSGVHSDAQISKFNTVVMLQSFENKEWVKSLLQDGNGGLFISEFTKRYPDFVNELENRMPDLNSMDFKVCALLRLDFYTKEIAVLTNSSVRSVESRKYRIRKKLNLSSQVDLTLYMVQLVCESNLKSFSI